LHTRQKFTAGLIKYPSEQRYEKGRRGAVVRISNRKGRRGGTWVEIRAKPRISLHGSHNYLVKVESGSGELGAALDGIEE